MLHVWRPLGRHCRRSGFWDRPLAVSCSVLFGLLHESYTLADTGYGQFRQPDTWEPGRLGVQWSLRVLLPRIGFIVTNLRWKSYNVVKFYNGRGTSEQWIKEGKYALNWTRLSCHDFIDNQVRLQLFVLAYNLGNFLRRLVLPDGIREWSLTTLKEKLIKIGAKVVRHARYFIFQMAEVAVPWALLGEIIERIRKLKVVPVSPG